MTLIGSMIRGDYEVISATIEEADPINPGFARVRDITTDSLVFSAKRDSSSPATLIQKTSLAGGGITKTDAAAGQLEIEILPADTDTLTSETVLYCDIEGTTSTGRPYTGLFQVRVVPDITR